MPPRDHLSEDLAIIKSEVIHLRKDVNKLLDIILENQSHAISPRLRIVENDMIEATKTIDEMKSQSGQIRLALLGAFLTFIVSVAVLVFEIGFKKS